MKNTNKQFLFIAAGLVSISTSILAISTVQAKVQISKELSTTMETENSVTGTAINTKTISAVTDAAITERSDDNFVYTPFYDSREQASDDGESYYSKDFIESTFAYRGHVISVTDDMADKAAKKKNAKLAIDIILDVLQPDLLDDLQMNTDSYSFSLTRQYQIPEHTYYNVVFVRNHEVQASVLVNADNGTVVNFTRDGLIDITYECNMSKEYTVDRWSDEKKTEVYEKFLPKAQDIIQNKMHLPAIMDSTFDPEKTDYINGSSDCSLLSLGYQLENGMFIQLIFDQISMDWDGFVVLGCDTDILNDSSYNETKEGRALLSQYGLEDLYNKKLQEER